MVKFCTGELQLCNEDGVTIGGEPLRGNDYSNFCPGSQVGSRGVTCEVFYTGEICILSRTDFAPILSSKRRRMYRGLGTETQVFQSYF